MRVVLISFVTPASENIRGTSALPYHLIKGTLPLPISDKEGVGEIYSDNKDLSFTIYTFNNNQLPGEKIVEVEKELGVTIKNIPLPKWYQWMFKLHLLFLRIFLKYPFVNYIKLPQRYVKEIKAQKPDLIWVMGEELSRVVKQFPETRRIQIGPDTESLYYYRLMGKRFVMNSPMSYWKCALMYRKYARMERDFCTDENFTYHAVGLEDVSHLHQLNPEVNAMFLRHPHYEVSNHCNMHNSLCTIKFHQPKIKLLVAGQYNLYMKQEADLLSEELILKSEELIPHYVITFLGKGWEKHVEALRNSGYEVEHIKFAPDYIEEVTKHDIQITPIAIGTGTKGKVLDALANGLLVIGTPYALENIAVKHGESCVEYSQPHEVISVLMDIPKNLKNYEDMAAKGKKQVLLAHSPKQISSQLFKMK
jgi:hypothetical protein